MTTLQPLGSTNTSGRDVALKTHPDLAGAVRAALHIASVCKFYWSGSTGTVSKRRPRFPEVENGRENQQPHPIYPCVGRYMPEKNSDTGAVLNIGWKPQSREMEENET